MKKLLKDKTLVTNTFATALGCGVLLLVFVVAACVLLYGHKRSCPQKQESANDKKEKG